MRRLVYLVKSRLAGAFEYLRTGRVESFDDLERVNQVMHELGFPTRAEAQEFVDDELVRLWEAEYPSEFAYWDEPAYSTHELSHLWMRPQATHHGPWCEEGSPCETCVGDAIAKSGEAIARRRQSPGGPVKV